MKINIALESFMDIYSLSGRTESHGEKMAVGDVNSVLQKIEKSRKFLAQVFRL